jgi:Tol biopolymer transport system component
MANPYGPWATLIDVGGNPQLSAFWRRRLTMLVPASQTSPTLSRRNLLWLGAAGALSTVLPTIRAASAVTDEDKPAEQAQKSLSGRIFVRADLITRPNGVHGIIADWMGKLKDVRGIIAIDPETGQWEKITDADDDPRASRDGKMLAFPNRDVSVKDGAVPTEIWTCDLTSRHAAKVAEIEGTSVCWSPDGKQFAGTKLRFTEDAKSHSATWEMNVDGSGQKDLPIPETDYVADWSDDGKWFVAVTNREPPFGCGYQLYRMHPDGSEELRLTKDGLNCYPRFSPDSRQIVYLHQGKQGSLHVIDVDGTNDHEVLRDDNTATVEAACFSPDGRRLAVLRYNGQVNEKGELTLDALACRLEIMDVDGKNRRELPLVGASITWLGHPDWR